MMALTRQVSHMTTLELSQQRISWIRHHGSRQLGLQLGLVVFERSILRHKHRLFEQFGPQLFQTFPTAAKFFHPLLITSGEARPRQMSAPKTPTASK